ncbi:bifunctional YncE family protein/alkaline phosphatase family protein [Mangrovibacterium diazotrophicum]|uniref:DNA-binding beta-propeller fold protein YncE n=1 Tax=Mangrovibacterium diazotrophicum TaxID=1261403 RepID=A0A419VYL7_9BACT|nr:bifunctional YncE family protein/alkaline phosphatase family protein [Mangrovibacterium diazotrophicum]RKD88249.1 DNA-binding beta-propeller fold protein YncE [Mangrovibacterium diazotrophicum]
MNMKSYLLAALVLAMGACKPTVQTVKVLQVPGRDQYCKIDHDGITVLPSGRFVTPVGEVLPITNDPYGMAISPDGKKAVTLHNGVITIVDTEKLMVQRVPSYDGSVPSPLVKGSYLGVSFGGDSRYVYLSGGDNGDVVIYDLEKLQKVGSISLDGKFKGEDFEDSFTSDLVYDPDKNELLVLDRANFRMVRLNLDTKKITGSVRVGRQPFGIAISPDRKQAFVANVGVYSYPLITGATPENVKDLMISHHPYGENTPESRNGTLVEGKQIPGLGDPNSLDAMSVFTIDLEQDTVISKFKTGYLVGETVEDAEVVGGASPNSIAVGREYAYVTNATNDNVAIIDYRTQELVGRIPIKIDDRIDHVRGLLPFGITMSKDEKTLYVALLGFNAVAVIDIPSRTTTGLIPSGWGPTRVELSNDDKDLYIITCRGWGAGPTGGQGFVAPVQGSNVNQIQLGSFQKVAVPTTEKLAEYTKQAIGNTFKETEVEDDGTNPLPPVAGLRQSPIKHIVYITKENRTYDEIFGQLKNGAIGDSTLARFGVNNTYTLPDSVQGLFPNLRISPNHIKAAKQFAFSDNYYCDSDASVHGHHWLVGVIPNEWVEANAATSKTAKWFSKAEGRRPPQTIGSIDPEDYGEIGGMWEAMERRGVDFYNFGQANESGHEREEWYDTNTGAAHAVMIPMPKALFKRTSHNYAGYNMNIPDQYRMDQFEKEFTEKWIDGECEMPAFVTMMIPNDHGTGPRPEDGYPYRQSYMVDNDLAVGRVLHFLSRTKYWKDMLVIITEDDPQGGVDHIDGHRSVLMMAGPYVKHGYVSHTHANFGAILKTIYNILDVPNVNHFDLTASLLQDFFTDEPDFTPYTLERHDSRIFDAELAMKKYHKTIDWTKIEQGPDMDDVDDAREDFQKNYDED